MSVGEIAFWVFSAFMVVWPSVLISLMVRKRRNYVIKLGFFLVLFFSLMTILTINRIIYFSVWWGSYMLYGISFLVLLLCNDFCLKESVYLWAWSMVFEAFLAQLPGFLAEMVNGFGNFKIHVICKVLDFVIFTISAGMLIRYIDNKGLSDMTWWEVAQALIIPITVSVFNRQVFISVEDKLGQEPGRVIFMLQILSALCAILILFMQREIHYRKRMQADNAMRERLWALERKQFEERKEQIELINRKCHDLKHQIAALEFISDKQEYKRNIQELKDAVNMYDEDLHTGNLALETILKEKKLQYEKEGIILKCVIDAVPPEIIDVVDLYVLLGNILDNSIDSVKKLDKESNRCVELSMYRDRNFIRLVCSNRFNCTLVFDDGLPISTKGDDNNHGFGLKSIRQIVNKYNGAMTIDTDDGVFVLKILIPIPRN